MIQAPSYLRNVRTKNIPREHGERGKYKGYWLHTAGDFDVKTLCSPRSPWSISLVF